MKKKSLLIVLLAVILAACAPAVAPAAPTSQPPQIVEVEVTREVTVEVTRMIEITAIPTETATPLPTPVSMSERCDQFMPIAKASIQATIDKYAESGVTEYRLPNFKKAKWQPPFTLEQLVDFPGDGDSMHDHDCTFLLKLNVGQSEKYEKHDKENLARVLSDSFRGNNFVWMSFLDLNNEEIGYYDYWFGKKVTGFLVRVDLPR
jgi:hypothetical protein